MEGRIALARRGAITFQSKVTNVFAAGAVGLVVYANVSCEFQDVLQTKPESPVISISQEDGETIGYREAVSVKWRGGCRNGIVTVGGIHSPRKS